MPGEESFHSPENVTIRFAGGKIASIAADGRGGQSLTPTNSSLRWSPRCSAESDRSKRQIVTFDEIPKNLVNAVIAIEDRRFFQHSGVNYFRLMEAASTDILHGHRGQGGSTLTMQLSRGFFLSPEKTVKRKLTEMLIAIELEQKFSKQRIFEMYANQVPMGQRGSFGINGFGEASRAYFNKDMKDLTLPECALLAGIIQRPSYLSPYRHPERALERRNLVLDSMVETGAITREQADHAKATPLKLAAPNVEASDAPYFVDLVKDQLTNQYNESELNEQAMRIYTTLDPDLQRAAADAVEVGMKLVDEQVLKQRTHKTKTGTGATAKTEVSVRLRPAAASRGRRPRSSYRRSPRAGWRPQLRHQPARSRRRKASHGIDLQALCLRGCHQHRSDGAAPDRHGQPAGDWRQRAAHHRHQRQAGNLHSRHAGGRLAGQHRLRRHRSTSRATTTRHFTAQSPPVTLSRCR